MNSHSRSGRNRRIGKSVALFYFIFLSFFWKKLLNFAFSIPQSDTITGETKCAQWPFASVCIKILSVGRCLQTKSTIIKLTDGVALHDFSVWPLSVSLLCSAPSASCPGRNLRLLNLPNMCSEPDSAHLDYRMEPKCWRNKSLVLFSIMFTILISLVLINNSISQNCN